MTPLTGMTASIPRLIASLREARRERDELRQYVEDAPHHRDCDQGELCDCWKSRLKEQSNG